MMPLFLIKIDALDILDPPQSLDMRLFCTLAGEEVGCGIGEYEPNREIRVVGEGVQDVRDFDGCYRATGREKEMVFAVVGVLGG